MTETSQTTVHLRGQQGQRKSPGLPGMGLPCPVSRSGLWYGDHSDGALVRSGKRLTLRPMWPAVCCLCGEVISVDTVLAFPVSL